jgi:hypothetical protein
MNNQATPVSHTFTCETCDHEFTITRPTTRYKHWILSEEGEAFTQARDGGPALCPECRSWAEECPSCGQSVVELSGGKCDDCWSYTLSRD